MKSAFEIDNNYYCSAGFFGEDCCSYHLSRQCPTKGGCRFYHRKFPTPQQFREEYGGDYPDDGAVWWIQIGAGIKDIWHLDAYKTALQISYAKIIVCSVSPWGKPPDDYRPEV